MRWRDGSEDWSFGTGEGRCAVSGDEDGVDLEEEGGVRRYEGDERSRWKRRYAVL